MTRTPIFFLVSFFRLITLCNCEGKKWLWHFALGHQGQGTAAVLLVHDALPHVLLQGGGDAEGHVAEPALELVVPHPAVGLHVPRQFAALSTRVGTELAPVRLLPRVTSPVHGQVAAVLEHFPAELARVVAAPADQVLPCVRVKDSVEAALLGEGLDGAGFHGGHLHAHGERWQGNVFEARSSRT